MTGLRNLVTVTHLLMLMLLLMSHTTAGSRTLLGTRRHANVPNKRYCITIKFWEEGRKGRQGRRAGKAGRKGREGKRERGAWWD